MNKSMNLSEIDIQIWFEEIASRKGLIGVPFDYDIEVIKSLVIEYKLNRAISEQCFSISKPVMKEIITLLQTDGINSKKEVREILQTYIDEGDSDAL